MKPNLLRIVLFSSLLATVTPAQEPLWQIGEPDRDNREFALAPSRFNQYADDGFYVVGRSSAARDWPYVHPGPSDTWAGSRRHSFSIIFGIAGTVPEGTSTLWIDLIDSQGSIPPTLDLAVNSHSLNRAVAPGAGDASVHGDPSKGKRQRLEFAIPHAWLRAGANDVSLTTTSGSWMLYDALGMSTPSRLELVDVDATALGQITSPQVLIEKEGQLFQKVAVTIRHAGPEQKVVLKLDNIASTNLVLARPTLSLDLLVPALAQSRAAHVQLEKENGDLIRREEILLQPVRKWTVYLLPHSHVDIGYTHVQAEVERAQWRYLEEAIEVARKTAAYPEGSRFKWNVEVLWAVDSYVKQAGPEKVAALTHAIDQGWIGLDALYGNELTALCRPEELMQLLNFSGRLAGRLNTKTPIESAMITDVPGYTWGMVPALAQHGIKYFSIGPNGGDRIGFTLSSWGDKPFYWTSPSGAERVLCWVAGTGYYRVFESADRLQRYLGDLERKAYPYEITMVRHCLGDNAGPDTAFAETVRNWNAQYAYPKLVIATTAQMFRDFEARYGAQIPTVRGDFTPYWEDGAGSSARETALNREAAERLVQAEVLWSQLQPENFPREAFQQAWRNVVLYDEHTWGAHNSISEPDSQFVRDQWRVKQSFALDAAQQSEKLLEAVLSKPATAARRIDAVDVLNSSSWPRSDLVVIPQDWAVTGDRVLTSAGEAIPSQRLASGELVFIARDVPAFGSARFRLHQSTPAAGGGAHASGNKIKNQTLAAAVHPETGALLSFRWKSPTGEIELVKTNSPLGLNEFFYVPGKDPQAAQRNGRVQIHVKEKGPVLASLLAESAAPGCRSLKREIWLFDGSDRLGLVNYVDKLPVRRKEGVHFAFPFAVPAGVIRMDVPWAVVRPETDQLQGACKNWFTVQRWVDISNADFGVTWATLDAPLVEVGAITAELPWIEHLPPTQTIYSYVMNNYWHTNYRAEQDGPTVFRYALQPHGNLQLDAAARLGASVSQPLIVTPALKQPAVPLVQVQPAGVLVTALRPALDGSGWILRLYAASGQAERAKLSWTGPARAFLSDGLERKLHEVEREFDIPPFGVVTLRLIPQNALTRY